MGIDFRILIIDDDDDLISEYSEQLKEYCYQFGVILHCDKANDEEELEQYLKYIEKYDLLMVDLKFGKVNMGDRFIKNIKRKCPSSDVLFYSSSQNELLECVKNISDLGIYYALRMDGTGKVITIAKKMVDKFVYRINECQNFRGMILSYFSEIENIIRDFIKEDLNKLDKDFIISINNKYIRHNEESLFNNLCKYITSVYGEKRISKKIIFDNCWEVKEDFCVSKIIDEFSLCNVERVIELFQCILKKKKITFSHELIEHIKNLKKERNKFAHCISKDGKLLSKLGDIDVNNKYCTEIRILITEIFSLLKEVNKLSTISIN